MIPMAYFAPIDSPGGPLVWLFGSGIGTNIGASILWGFLAGLVGLYVARKLRTAWHSLHQRLDRLHDRHDEHQQHMHAVHLAIKDVRDRLDQLSP